MAFFNNYKYFFFDQPLLDFSDVLPGTWATLTNLWPRMRLVNIAFHDLPPEAWIGDRVKELASVIVLQLISAVGEPSEGVYKTVQLYLRWAIARGGSGPPMHTTMAILGREVCLQRLDEFANLLDQIT